MVNGKKHQSNYTEKENSESLKESLGVEQSSHVLSNASLQYLLLAALSRSNDVAEFAFCI